MNIISSNSPKGVVSGLLVILILLCRGDFLHCAENWGVGDGDAPKNGTESPKWYSDTIACYRNVDGFRALFTHEFISRFGKRGAAATGEIQVSQNGYFRMAYTSPSAKLVVYNGKRIRAWDGETGMHLEDTGSDDLLFTSLIELFGKPLISIKEGFGVRQLRKTTATEKDENSSLEVVELIPRETDPLIRKIVITFGDCPTVRRIILVDQAGNMIRLTLEQIELVKTFTKADFRFDVFPDSTVIRP